MASDRMNSSRDEFENQPARRSNASGHANAGTGINARIGTNSSLNTYGGGLSRSQRSGGNIAVVRPGSPSMEARGASVVAASSEESPGKGKTGNTAKSEARNQGRGSAAAAEADEDDEEYEYYSWPLWLRIILWLLRKSIVPVVMVVMLLAGLYVGYVIVGEQSKADVFEWATWQHLYDLIFADS